MEGMDLEGWMKKELKNWMILKKEGNIKWDFEMMLKKDENGEKYEKDMVGVVRKGKKENSEVCLKKLRKEFIIGRNGEEKNVGMEGGIFGWGVNDDVKEEIERKEIKRCRKGIVNNEDGIEIVGGLRDGRNIMYIECVGGGWLSKKEIGVRENKIWNVRKDLRIVILEVKKNEFKDSIGEVEGRVINRIEKKRMIEGWKK